MTTEKKHIDELHFEHQLWLRETTFYKEELKIYQQRLDEVAKKNTKEEAAKQIGHFQNQFIIQKEQLDILQHLVNEHEQFIAKFAAGHPVAIDHQLFANHEGMHDKVEIFKKLYYELKKEFRQFLSVWM